MNYKILQETENYTFVEYPDSFVISKLLFNWRTNVLQAYFENGDEIHYIFDKWIGNGKPYTLKFIQEESYRSPSSVGSLFNVYIKNNFVYTKLEMSLLFGYYITNSLEVDEFDDYVENYVKNVDFRASVNNLENKHIPNKICREVI